MVLRAAIIGCGKIAGGYDRVVPSEWSLTHAGAYHICPETQLVAVADSNLHISKEFAAKWQAQNAYSDYREMLEKERLDILSICLPTEYHLEVFKAALHHDIRGILCEKPLSRDIEEARKMAKLGQDTVVTVNYFRRFNRTLSDIRNHILNQKLGKCLHTKERK